ncbi:hypothetical protein NIES2100_28550 [Calothrix sp. NIES-2100]|nr:hypothetical protein NIES2100_28550 [Calothrix sp. NIES-2100]
MVPIVTAPLPVYGELGAPLWGLGAGRQSTALSGWGSWDLVSNQADII